MTGVNKLITKFISDGLTTKFWFYFFGILAYQGGG